MSETSTLRKHLPDFRKLVILAIFYAAFAFTYSTIAFLHPQAAPHYHEYSRLGFLVEITGHFSFGFVAAIPFLDLEMCLLTGAAAVLIDADHVLSALNFNVSGRPDHSFLFVFVSAIVLIWVARRFGFSKSFLIKFVFFAPVVVFSHISYDVFAQTGSSAFQLFIPFSFAYVTFPQYDWILFEALALALSCFGYLLSRRWSQKSKGNVMGEESMVGNQTGIQASQFNTNQSFRRVL